MGALSHPPYPKPSYYYSRSKTYLALKKNFFFKLFPRAQGREKAQAAPWARGGPTRARPLEPREGRGVWGCRRLRASSRAPHSLCLPLHVVRINSLLSSSVTPWTFHKENGYCTGRVWPWPPGRVVLNIQWSRSRLPLLPSQKFHRVRYWAQTFKLIYRPPNLG